MPLKERGNGALLIQERSGATVPSYQNVAHTLSSENCVPQTQATADPPLWLGGSMRLGKRASATLSRFGGGSRTTQKCWSLFPSCHPKLRLSPVSGFQPLGICSPWDSQGTPPTPRQVQTHCQGLGVPSEPSQPLAPAPSMRTWGLTPSGTAGVSWAWAPGAPGVTQQQSVTGD